MWDGNERRKTVKEFCESHISLTNDMASIKTSLINIEKTITEGVTFKTGVVTSILGLALTIVIAIVSFSYLIGQMNKQIEVNTIWIHQQQQIQTEVKR